MSKMSNERSVNDFAATLGVSPVDYARYDSGAYDEIPPDEWPEWVRQLDDFTESQFVGLMELLEKCKEAG
jgi:hypothetical protein